MSDTKTIKKFTCEALKASDRNILAIDVSNFINKLTEVEKETIKIDFTVVCDSGNRYYHFAYITYFSKVEIDI